MDEQGGRFATARHTQAEAGPAASFSGDFLVNSRWSRGDIAVTEVQMNAQSMLGMFHAQELLLISLIRALPPETRRRIADEFQEQVELAEAPHLSAGHEHETTEVFKAHIRKLSILLASLS
jgi:hypothetical protein